MNSRWNMLTQHDISEFKGIDVFKECYTEEKKLCKVEGTHKEKSKQRREP